MADTAAELFSDFDSSSWQQWKEQLKRDLKGLEPEELQSQTADQLVLQPLYTSENSQAAPQPYKATAKWDSVAEIEVDDPKLANAQALDLLNRGATSLLFYLYANADLDSLLREIQLPYIRCNFVVEGDVVAFARGFLSYCEKQGYKREDLAGSINVDPIENLARSGRWFVDEESDFLRLKTLADILPGQFKSLCANLNLFGNAGATPAMEIGIALASAHELLHRTQSKTLASLWVNVAIGNQYFEEIAKLRALRRVFHQLGEDLDLEPSEVQLYAETGLRNKSQQDPHNNLVRTGIEAMSAVLGGANEICVKPYNAHWGADAMGQRLALNQLHLLQYESHLDATLDMSSGSYFIEELTEQLAEKGWAFFVEIEECGGIVEALKSNWLQSVIQEADAKSRREYREGNRTLIGVNKYTPESKAADMSPGPSPSSESGIQKLKAVALYP